MAVQGKSLRRGLLVAASVIVPVAGAVAGNQVLDNGVWSRWWALAALALAAAGAAVGHRLTAAPHDRDGSPTPATAGSGPLQSVAGLSAGRNIVQVHGSAGGVRIGRGEPAPAAVTSPDTMFPSSAIAPEQEAGNLPSARQSVSRSTVGGSVIQVSGTGGDVTVEGT